MTKLRATTSALALALGIAIGSGTATAEPVLAPATEQRHEAMAGFSAPPCLPLILPPAVNVSAFLICLA
ncbi:hypothetical protein IU486_31680 [Streptomyces gardneri]|uniref:hypothetical protein n=1 Tax=Nocardia TaxID=1817 RepID=UPI0013575049|nr:MULTISPECIES: hypothetical protein [Nocardia]MBF6169262.1 hypothetical protein [Streptomyces gardneri]MBF6207996.1 hypothetical protein [Streptomyces gardneri]